MNTEKAFAFDILDIAEQVTEFLKKHPTIERKKIKLDRVLDAIFDWLDHYYLQNQMRWCPKPPSSIEQWGVSLGVDPKDLLKGSPHRNVVNNLEMYFNELLADLFPGRTWKMLFLRRLGDSGFVLEVGEDYRINFFMDNMFDEKTGRAKSIQAYGPKINATVSQLENKLTIDIDLDVARRMKVIEIGNF